MMSQNPPFHSKYSYNHLDGKSLFQAIDVHDVIVKKSRLRIFLSYFGIAVFLTTTCYFVVMKELCISSIWSILVCFLLAKVLHYKPVKKESVVIMPQFGVQLETHYWRLLSHFSHILLFLLAFGLLKAMSSFLSGRVIRRFVPISKILKPVLNECVTPITCYWSLALILLNEGELMLVFQKLQPPIKILVPVWKALCAATDCKEISTI